MYPGEAIIKHLTFDSISSEAIAYKHILKKSPIDLALNSYPDFFLVTFFSIFYLSKVVELVM